MIRLLLLTAILGYWPLPTNQGVTGTFTEFRNNHLHAGMDMSTSGRVGLPVTCFEEGVVFRIKVQKRGYGKVMYVRHPGIDRITVYGHLDRFMPELEEIVDRYRLARHTRYPGDIFLEHPVSVRKNQIIAYSGETGAGWPHLHFEIRDLANRPINPVSEGFDMKYDRTPPRFHALHIYPETAGSRINDSNHSQRVPIEQLNASTFSIQSKIRTSGPFLASVDVTDGDGKKGPLGIRELTMFVNGEPAYRFHARQFTYDNWWQTAAVYDFNSTRLSPSRYTYNLFRIPGSTVSVQEDGKAGFQNGTNRIRIEALDFNNNRSTLNFIWICSAPAPPSPTTLDTGAQYSDGSTVIDAAAIVKQRTLSIENQKWDVVRVGPEPTHIHIRDVEIEWQGFSRQWRLARARPAKPNAYPKDLIPVKNTCVDTGPGLSFLRSIQLTYEPGRQGVSEKEDWYRFDPDKQKWIVLSRKEPSTTQSLASSYYRTARFAVFRDEARPIIHGNPEYLRNMTVWKVTDIGSGIDDERITLKRKDGKIFQMDYDPDRKLAFVDGKLKPGIYVIRVFDHAGNEGSARGRLH